MFAYRSLTHRPGARACSKIRRGCCGAPGTHTKPTTSPRPKKSFAAALKGEPQNFDVLDGLGLINYRRGRLDAALVLIQTALQSTLAAPMVFRASASSLSRSLAPNDVDLINRRGVALLELGRPDEALAAFERLLAHDENYREALGNRGNALIKLNRAADALESYDRALASASGNAQLLTNRAVALRRLDGRRKR